MQLLKVTKELSVFMFYDNYFLQEVLTEMPFQKKKVNLPKYIYDTIRAIVDGFAPEQSHLPSCVIGKADTR